MKKCITTLPITPCVDCGIGLAVAPFIMDVIGRKMELKRILAMSVGNKGNNIEAFVESMNSFGVNPDCLWQENKEKSINWIMSFFHDLKDRGFILKEKVEMLVCLCGAVQTLIDADNMSESRKLYYSEAGKYYCRVCKNEISVITSEALLFVFPDISDSIKTFPNFYEKEIADLACKFLGKKFLISRFKNSGSVFSLGDGLVLDIDFAWQMFLSILLRFGYEPDFLVSSNRNILADCFLIALYKLIDNRKTTIIITPYYLSLNKEKLKGDKYLLNFFVKKYGVKVIRLLFAANLNWNKKISIFDFRILDMIARNCSKIKTEPIKKSESDDVLGEVVKELNANEIKMFLSKIRSKDVVSFNSSKLYGII